MRANATIASQLSVRSVQAEPRDHGLPWGWIAAVLIVLSVGALIASDRLVRRRP